MPLHRQLQHLIENLIALKDLYHTQLVESEKKVARFKEQLSHVNGLLVAQLVENQQFVQSLVDMRSQCHAQLEANQRQAAHAREQLIHVNALLADQVVLPPAQHPFELHAAAIEARQQQALSGTEPEAEQFSLPLAVPQQQPQTEESTASLEVEQTSEESTSSTPKVEQTSEETARSASAIKTPMKSEYQNLTKIQAVEKLLQENQGKILTVEYIIWSLYDDMDTEAVKAEKPRIYDTLGQGMEKGLWEKVPDQPACYTYRLSLVEPAADSASATTKTNSRLAVSSRRRPSRRGRSDDMLPRYNHLSLTAAVEVVVNEHPGEVITTEKVAKELYGEDIEGRALIKAKDRIGKTLWGGATQGRWQRIPGRLGCYTLSLKTLKKG
jgi:chemotaxis protein histidine kinase CheA